MKPFKFHPEAQRELRAAALFYREESPRLGLELVREVRVVLERIAQWPESGSAEQHDVNSRVSHG